jgi:hypothetical protein
MEQNHYEPQFDTGDVHDRLSLEFDKYEAKRLSREKLWGNVSKFLILAYVFLGGGYEIVMGIVNHHVQASFVFSFMSSLIFLGRIFYALYSGAVRTMWADVCGVTVMLVLSILHVIINGSFL